MIEEITIDELVESLQLAQKNFVRKSDQDFVIVTAGYEGGGKSKFSFYLGIKLQDTFNVDHMTFEYEDYKKLQAGYIDHRGTGDVVVFDEGGTKLNSRKAMWRTSVNMMDVFISNRFLNLIHIITVPKIAYLDKYIREERVRMLIVIWFDTDDDAESTERYSVTQRHAYIYNKDNLSRIFMHKNWQKAFYTIKQLTKTFPPDAHMIIPNIDEQIPKDQYKKYLEKKKKFAYNILSGDPYDDNNNKKKNKDNQQDKKIIKFIRKLRYGKKSTTEQIKDFKKETGGMSKQQYHYYVRKYAPETINRLKRSI